MKEVLAILLGEGEIGDLGTSSKVLERISVEMMASWAQTISYEIVGRFPGHLERKLVS
jgi:hypothetical protein